jgi:prolyl-tRNA synthetase
MAKKPKNAISPTRAENYPDWFQAVIKEADMAEIAHVRGCMVIKPWGYGLWERIQRELDDRIKATGHENAYFPLFIPLSYIEKEAAHVEGFAKECAVVTHHRLEANADGTGLVPAAELPEPLVVRPTSETIIGESFRSWVQSYRDLPILLNQWANVVRWELRPRVFLRTTEFLWQEGHTAHASEAEALDEMNQMLEVYRELAEDVLAIPVLTGPKPENERFPGAVETLCIEAMMQDGKALQAGTSHYLGQNFAKAANIEFVNKDNEPEFAYTTSWGVSTRLVGGVIMTHGDDDGLRVPPKIAPWQIVIVPYQPGGDDDAVIMDYAKKLQKDLCKKKYDGLPVRAHLDARDIRPIDKRWQWVKKGVPIVVEVGKRDIDAGNVAYRRRDNAGKNNFGPRDEFVGSASKLLAEIQKVYFEQAKAFRDANMHTHLTTYDEFVDWFNGGAEKAGHASPGFVRAKWCGERDSEELYAKHKVTIRCLPTDQSGTEGTCILTGKPATLDAIYAKAY